MIRRLKKYLSERDGSVVVEAALVLPFVITVGIGAVDASNMLLQNHKLETQLTMAGNFLAKSRTPAQFETEAKNLACSGRSTATSTKCIIPNWTVSDIQVSYATVSNSELDGGFEYRDGTPVQIVRVSSNIQYTGFGLISSIFGGSIQLSGAYEERVIGA